MRHPFENLVKYPLPWGDNTRGGFMSALKEKSCVFCIRGLDIDKKINISVQD